MRIRVRTAEPGTALLERAVSYALGCVDLVEPRFLANATPCPDWDLQDLLRHVNDSLDVLLDGLVDGRVWSGDVHAGPPDGVAAFRARAAALLAACAAGSARDRVAVGGCGLASVMVAATGAIEIAVHGWDIAVACAAPRPLPPGLAAELNVLARLLVADNARAGLFGGPIELAATSGAGDRLIAYLGRRPAR